MASKFKRQCKLDNRQTRTLSPRRILIFGGGLPLQNFDGRSCEKVTTEGEAISCSQRHGGAHESAEDAAQAIPQMPIVTKKGCPQLEVQISKIKTVHHRDASARQRVSGSPARCHERGPDLGRPHVSAARARIQPHAFPWRAGLPSADATPVTAPIPCRLHPSATRPLRSFLLRVRIGGDMPGEASSKKTKFLATRSFRPRTRRPGRSDRFVEQCCVRLRFARSHARQQAG